jgi:hypothetical protein
MAEKRSKRDHDPQGPEEPSPPDEPRATPEPSPGTDNPEADAPESGAADGDEPVRSVSDAGRLHGPRTIPPWDGIAALERQWEDRTPLAERRERLVLMVHTTDEDPRGWDHIAALSGASPGALASVSGLWLECQLAADTLEIGRLLRPRVDLVAAGRRWHVVRTVLDGVVAHDGRGHRTPSAALRAAALRYHAELLRELTAERVARSVAGAEPEPALDEALARPGEGDEPDRDDASTEDSADSPEAD